MSSLKIVTSLHEGGWAGYDGVSPGVSAYWTQCVWYKHASQTYDSDILKTDFNGQYAAPRVTNADNYLRLNVAGTYYKSDGTASTASTDGQLLSVGTWYHIALVINASAQARVDLYMCPEGSSTYTLVGFRNVGGSSTSPTYFSVGDITGNNNSALGLYAHCRIWWAATNAGSLSTTQLNDEKDSADVVLTTNNQIAWKLPGLGQTDDTVDDSGNGYTLTYVSPTTKVSYDAEDAPVGGGGASFQSAWAKGSNVIIKG